MEIRRLKITALHSNLILNMASSVCAVEGTPERILRVPLSSESLGLVLQGPTVNNYFFDKKSSSLARNTKAKLSVFALLGVFE